MPFYRKDAMSQRPCTRCSIRFHFSQEANLKFHLHDELYPTQFNRRYLQSTVANAHHSVSRYAFCVKPILTTYQLKCLRHILRDTNDEVSLIEVYFIKSVNFTLLRDMHSCHSYLRS